MNIDPFQPASTPSKKSPPIPSPSEDGTEQDLWDLDTGDEETGTSRPESARSKVASIPAQRAGDSYIRSGKSAERIVGVSVLPEAEFDKLPTLGKTTSIFKKQLGATDLPDNNSPPHEIDDDTDTEDYASPNIIKNDKSAPETIEEKSEPMARKAQNLNKPKTQAVPPFLSSFSKFEKIGIAALIIILAISATLTILYFSKNVPTRPLVAEKLELPISGKLGLVTITAVDTYWRVPVASGEMADVVRRGTMLIPVLKISLDSKPAALRVLFRDDDGNVMGDVVTRDVSGKSETIIPATAGFDDIGMHASYRTGGSKRWLVEVFEAASSSASREKFKKIFETEISPDLRK